MKIGVIVTNKNKAHYVWFCLDALLAQTKKPDVIVFSDEYSEDGSDREAQEWAGEHKKELESSGIKFFFHRAVGIGKSCRINEAAKYVRDCDYVSICSADDFFKTEFFEVMSNEAERRTGNFVLFCDYHVTDSNGNIIYPVVLPQNLREENNFLIASRAAAKNNTMIASMCTYFFPSRLLFEEPFDEVLKENEDLEWHLRILYVRKISFIHVPQVLVCYRESTSQTSATLTREKLYRNNQYTFEKMRGLTNGWF